MGDEKDGRVKTATLTTVHGHSRGPGSWPVRPLKPSQLLPGRGRVRSYRGTEKAAPGGLAAAVVPCLLLHNRVSGSRQTGFPRWGQSCVCSVHSESSHGHGLSLAPSDQPPVLGGGGVSKKGTGWQVDSSPSFLTGTWPWLGRSFPLGLSCSLCKMGVLCPFLLATAHGAAVL